jgi:nucleoside-diphosphate-sugar epimerase
LPQLGLARSVWDRLAASTTDILHCAADIRFNLPIGEARATNTQGTHTMLDLARDVKELHRFAFISTAYIMGRDTGELAESEHLNIAGYVNNYEQSKHEGEAAVFASMEQIPAAVFRLSSVAGTGSTYLQQALRLIPNNPFTVMPALPTGRVDLIDEYWAAVALNTLLERHFRRGAVFHICAGRHGSIPVGRLVELAFCSMGSRQPSMVSLERFERFAEVVLSNGAREVDKRMLRSLSHFLPHLALDQTFQNEVTMALLKEEGIAPPDSAEIFARVLAGVSRQLTRHTVPTGEAIR